MNKCLVTTLKAHTNNEALSKYNVITVKTTKISSPTVDSQWISIGASENGDVSLNSPSVGLYKNGINGELLPYPINIPANTEISSHFENKDGKIEITGKYNINKIICGMGGIVSIKEIYGMRNIKLIILKKIKENEVDATKLKNTFVNSEIKALDIVSNNVINKLNKNIFREFTSITTLSSFIQQMFENFGLDDIANNVNLININLWSGIIGGNLSSFAKLTNLEYISFNDLSQNRGDIMDFINPWIQAGRTSGKINVPWISGQKNITLNGRPISYPSGVFNASAYLNWTSDGTVTFTAS